ncbi:hypothetical protein E8L99_20580 [Phreatobacter aquaticus]|uniref:Uncharacterized protein n=1 Tax=Phreatobacter aquaticus TaxID=2570229 RepID=A0A4D7QSJ2_9HYPH|nr:hypothetical protein [Phreatobacter aquaticus]QCK87977.1 hypothetical protein E8L99_20580 [Phreatobacter aquaticus]
MRNSTILTTFLVAVCLGLAVLVLFFPSQVDQVVSSARAYMNPKHADIVRLEYTAADPSRARGWQSMRSYGTAEECLPALTRDYSRDLTIQGPIGMLRCVAYRKTGELVQVLKIHQPSPAR